MRFTVYCFNMNADEKKRAVLLQKALRAVVSISAVGKMPKSLLLRASVRASLEKLKKKGIDHGGGSGFIAHPSGIVVTNTHVIPRADCIYTVTTDDNRVFPADLIGTDEIHDVAFLKIRSGESFPCLKLGDSAKLMLGQTVYAVGNPLGYFKNTVSSGIISGLTRSIEAMNEEIKEELHGLIQTDAAINPGNSGGPLIDSSGEVIGINSAAVPHAENIAFAIPIHVIKNNLADILKFGKIRRAYLGVRHILINERIQQAFQLPVSYGVWAMSPAKKDAAVIAGSPAEKAGIAEEDIIAEINGKKLGENFTLEEFLEDAKGGQKVALTVFRKGKKLQLHATLVEKE
jgi:serine protease Do